MKISMRHTSSGFTTSEVVKRQFTLLCVLSETFPSVKIYTNFGIWLKEFLLRFTGEYNHHFWFHKFSNNNNKQHPHTYNIYHCIYSKLPISKLAMNEELKNILRKLNLQINNHPWSKIFHNTSLTVRYWSITESSVLNKINTKDI